MLGGTVVKSGMHPKHGLAAFPKILYVSAIFAIICGQITRVMQPIFCNVGAIFVEPLLGPLIPIFEILDA